MPLEFKPIDLNQHQDICLRFREDSFVTSFGDNRRFYEEDGKGAERYIEWLKKKIEKDPHSAIHVWEGGQIVGQMEMGLPKDKSSWGYVNLFYLIPEKRGQGLSSALNQHAMDYFKKAGLSVARLSVSPTNLRAVAYYQKMGWVDLGPRPEHPEVHFMEIKL